MSIEDWSEACLYKCQICWSFTTTSRELFGKHLNDIHDGFSENDYIVRIECNFAYFWVAYNLAFSERVFESDVPRVFLEVQTMRGGCIAYQEFYWKAPRGTLFLFIVASYKFSNSASISRNKSVRRGHPRWKLEESRHATLTSLRCTGARGKWIDDWRNRIDPSQSHVLKY